MKKRFIIAVSVLAAILMLAGCGASDDADSANSGLSLVSAPINDSDTSSGGGETSAVADTGINSEKDSGSNSETVNNELNTVTDDSAGSEEAVTNYDLNIELSQIENQSEEYENMLDSDAAQTELSAAALEWYTLWDDELNVLWGRLEAVLDTEEQTELLAKQREWIVRKEERMTNAGSEYEGGSMQTMAQYSKAAELTRSRCYELGNILAEKIGQTIAVPAVKYAGSYDDIDADQVLSSLNVTDNGDGTYTVNMSIFRLSTFDGTAVDAGNNTLHYSDIDIELEGDIAFNLDGSAAFTATVSGWEYIAVGDQFNFTDKM